MRVKTKVIQFFPAAPSPLKYKKLLKIHKLTDHLVRKTGTQTGSDPMKMSHYIVQRGTKYYFRARFPHGLVKTIGHKEFKKSLKADSYAQAVKNVPQVMLEFIFFLLSSLYFY